MAWSIWFPAALSRHGLRLPWSRKWKTAAGVNTDCSSRDIRKDLFPGREIIQLDINGIAAVAAFTATIRQLIA